MSNSEFPIPNSELDNRVYEDIRAALTEARTRAVSLSLIHI